LENATIPDESILVNAVPVVRKNSNPYNMYPESEVGFPNR
jgi:hypothetical protein